MRFAKIRKRDIQFWQDLLGDAYVLTDEEAIEPYSHDYTEDLKFYPEVVLCPGSVEEIMEIMRYCSRYHIPVTPAGGRTGLSGGMLPVYGGVLLSTHRLNRILWVDTENMQMEVECGVITQTIKEEAEKHGLYYPPDPSSMGSCTIGGNIAENAGGARAVKYGTTKDYILDLEVVLPTGERIRTANARTFKNVTGYNLTQLFIGSEGTLGVVTKAVLRLIAPPQERILISIPFKHLQDAAKAVSAILRHSYIRPSALEFMEKDAILFAQEYLGEAIEICDPKTTEALLWVELEEDENERSEDAWIRQTDELWYLIERMEFEKSGDLFYAYDKPMQERLWRIRRIIGEAVKQRSAYKEEDIVVPPSALPEILQFIKELGKAHGFRSVCYGHAGDGNIHVNILKENLSEQFWKHKLPEIIQQIFYKVKELGGTLSGEHGIGYVQKDYMRIFFNPTTLLLMKSIKQVFDPHGIMNPGKVFP